MEDRKGFRNVRPAQEDPRASASPRPEYEEDRQEGESRRAYELRKAMESSTGGDTRADKTRF